MKQRTLPLRGTSQAHGEEGGKIEIARQKIFSSKRGIITTFKDTRIKPGEEKTKIPGRPPITLGGVKTNRKMRKIALSRVLFFRQGRNQGGIDGRGNPQKGKAHANYGGRSLGGVGE